MPDPTPQTHKSFNPIALGIIVGVVLGSGVGAALGVAFGNVALGVSLGPAFGAAFGVVIGVIMQANRTTCPKCGQPSVNPAGAPCQACMASNNS